MPTLEAERMKGSALLERDEDWLRLHWQGWTIAELAGLSGCTVAFVRKRMRRLLKPKKKPAASADAIPLGLSVVIGGVVPMFPMGGTPFTPKSKCPHRGPIKDGSVLYCVVCHSIAQDRQKELDARHESREQALAASAA